MHRSTCCDAATKTIWGTTKFFECQECKNPCDAKKTVDDIDMVNETIKDLAESKRLKTDDVSDGDHTFWELYKHRITLFMVACKLQMNIHHFNLGEYSYSYVEKDWVKCIKSKKHEDGLDTWNDWGMFLLCLHHPEFWQISYHLDNKYWDKCDFAKTEEQATIPFDWHTPADVLERLLKL